MSDTNPSPQWHKTACILCSLNCGIEVKLGGENGRTIEKIRGDKAHPLSQGYTCEKPHNLDYYQNSTDRLRSPLRRKADGTFEAIDWDTAIREITDKFKQIKANYGGESILYYGGGSQGNHLGGSYADSTLKAIGSRFRSNALAQEKTGEMWVSGRMFGCGTHADFEHCEVAVFIGKNPWQSHGFSRARVILKQLAKDPARSMIVIDPRVSETAKMADYHLQIKPGTDAWCLSALIAILFQENLLALEWLNQHAKGLSEVAPYFEQISVAEFAQKCGVAESLLREVARRIARAKSVSVLEDLGMQMSVHSTLGSYLNRLLWVLTGHFGRQGTNFAFLPFVGLATLGKGGMIEQGGKVKTEKLSPVVGARVIAGLIPCNIIPEEILTDHPKRYRAMIVESGNPVHSLADSMRMREALKQLELVVVIDIAMTETTRLAHYILPAHSQFEKYEATFFNFDFPKNAFHLRRPFLSPMANTLPEPEIHSRLVEAMGVLPLDTMTALKQAASQGREAFAEAFFSAISTQPVIMQYAPVVLYRTLGPTLPEGATSAAVLWGASHLFIQANAASAARAGYDGEAFEAGEKLFAAILNSPAGVVFASDEYEESWRRVKQADGKINLVIPELLSEMAKLQAALPQRSAEFPFILSAGERRSGTANTIFRNPEWRKNIADVALRISPLDAQSLGVASGGKLKLSTRRGSLEVLVEVSEMMQNGHVSLPNGTGLDYDQGDGRTVSSGSAPNELTASEDRDFLAGTPWHKHIPAKLEVVA